MIDTRTVLFSCAISSIVCLAVISSLWRQHRGKYPGLGLLALNCAMQAAGTIMLALRGTVPDWMSFVLANTMVVGGYMLAYAGLERIVGKRGPQIHNIALLAVFSAVQFYFAFISPALEPRILNTSAGLLIPSLQCIWLLVFRVEPAMRRTVQWVALVFGGYCVVCLIRIAGVFSGAYSGAGYLQQRWVEPVLLLVFEMLLILLTFTLLLMVNRLLFLAGIADNMERRRLDEELSASKNFLEKTIDLSPFSMWISDARGVLLRSNRTLREALNVTEEQIAGRYNVLEDRNLAEEGVMPIVRDVYQKGIPARFTIPWHGERGGYKGANDLFIDVSMFPIMDNLGKVLNVVCQWVDVTEQKRAEFELRHALDLLRTTQQAARAGSWDWDMTTGRLFWSDEFLTLFGLPAGTVASFDTWRKTLHPDDMKEAEARINASVEQKVPLYNEYRIVRSGGEVVWISAVGNTVFDKDGRPVRMSGVCLDITGHKIAEEALKESGERYRILVEEATEAIAVYDLDLERFVDFNRKAEQLFGRTRDELLEHGVQKFYSVAQPDGRPVGESFKEHRERCSGGEPLIFERVIRRDDGTEKYCEVRLVRLPSRDRKLVRTSYIDITERKAAEEDLRRINSFLDSIVENIPNMLFLKEAKDLKFVRFNRAGEKLLGYSREELLGKNDYDFFPGEQADFFTGKDRAVLNGKVAVDVPEEPILSRSKGERILHTKKVPILDSGGEPVYLLGISEDITDRKRAEEEGARLQDQLLQAQKMESIGRLAGGVAHDFNNLLTAITGNVQMLMMDLGEKNPIYANLAEINEVVKSAGNLVRQLLAFSRKQAAVPRVIDIGGTVGGMVKLLKRILGEDIDVSIRIRDEGRVMIDPTQLEQIVVNMALNSRHAMPSGGKLTIGTIRRRLDEAYCRKNPYSVPGDYMELSVSDTGCGMTEEVKAHAFEPFFTTKAKGEGTGLGLASVYGIVKQNGGSVEVESEPGKGATFRILLPVHTGTADDAGEGRKDFNVQGGSEKIVLVEDEKIVREITLRILGKLGYSAKSFSRGDEALAYIEMSGEGIDLLITDVVMPGMNGRVLADRMTALRPGLKVLFTSGYTDNLVAPDNEINFIGKPYTPQALAKKVREVLDG